MAFRVDLIWFVVHMSSIALSSFLFFTLVTSPRRSLSLKLSDTRFYEGQTSARLGNIAQFYQVIVFKSLEIPGIKPDMFSERIFETTLRVGRRMWLHISGLKSGRTIQEGREIKMAQSSCRDWSYFLTFRTTQMLPGSRRAKSGSFEKLGRV